MNTKWDNLMLRVKEEAKRTARGTLANNKQRGIAIVTAHIVMGHDGEPLFWVVPMAKRIEPSKDAAEILMALAEEL
jgi:hypothetical protein